MNKAFVTCLVYVVSLLACTPNVEQQLTTSRDAAQQLASSLKSKLTSSLQSGGVAAAIAVCNLEAENITSAVRKDVGWRLGRTSLKIRNPSNVPDDWERKILVSFEQQKQSTADINNLEAYEIIQDDSGKWFRYMKAIPTTDACLLCHGESIAPRVQEKLNSLYPDDKAIGYKIGEIRGAFTIRQSF